MILDISIEDKKKYFTEKFKGGVIYKIINILNGEFYIGSSSNLQKRYYTHLYDIRKQNKTCIRLIRAVNKYKEENFKFQIIAKCPIQYVLKLEQWFLDNLKPEYNIAKIAGSNLGIKRTEEVKLNKSNSQKEKWQDEDYKIKHLLNLSNNWKSGIDHPFYGKSHSEESRKKISESKKGNEYATKNKVINIHTNEIYNSAIDCIRKNKNNNSIGSPKTFYLKLNGSRKNTTIYKYIT
jgi:group I intron endonuclease